MEYPKKLPAEIKQICQAVIELQEKMRNSYFWQPGGNLNTRKRWEDWNSQHFAFEYDGNKYFFKQKTVMSYRHCYFQSYFYVNGVIKDLRLVRKVLKAVEKDLAKDAQQEEIIER